MEETLEQQVERLNGQVGELTGKLRQANHFATFKELALSNGVKPKAVKALYGLVGYDPGDADEADPDAVLRVIQGGKAEHDFCFEPEEAEAETDPKPKPGETAPKKGTTPPAPTPKPAGLGSGRRQAPPAKEAFRVSLKDTRSPAWLLANGTAYAAAVKAGTLEILDF